MKDELFIENEHHHRLLNALLFNKAHYPLPSFKSIRQSSLSYKFLCNNSIAVHSRLFDWLGCRISHTHFSWVTGSVRASGEKVPTFLGHSRRDRPTLVGRCLFTQPKARCYLVRKAVHEWVRKERKKLCEFTFEYQSICFHRILQTSSCPKAESLKLWP